MFPFNVLEEEVVQKEVSAVCVCFQPFSTPFPAAGVIPFGSQQQILLQLKLKQIFILLLFSCGEDAGQERRQTFLSQPSIF